MRSVLVAAVVTLTAGAAPVAAWFALRAFVRGRAQLDAGPFVALALAAAVLPVAAPWLTGRAAAGLLRRAGSTAAGGVPRASAVTAGAWLGGVLGFAAILSASLLLPTVGWAEPGPRTSASVLLVAVFLGALRGARPAAEPHPAPTGARRATLGCLGALAAALLFPITLYLTRQAWVESRAARAAAALRVGMTAAEAIAAAEAAGTGVPFRADCSDERGETRYAAARLNGDRYWIEDARDAARSGSEPDRSAFARRLAERDAAECRRLVLSFEARDSASVVVDLEAGRVTAVGARSFTPD